MTDDLAYMTYNIYDFSCSKRRLPYKNCFKSFKICQILILSKTSTTIMYFYKCVKFF